MQGDQPVRFPSRILACSGVPSCGVLVVSNFVSWWWSDVPWCDVLWCHVVGLEVTSGRGMWLAARCHVMWCYVIWCDVMWRHAMSRHVVWCDVIWCDAMEWNDVGCNVMWWDVVVWRVELGDDAPWATETHVTAKPVRHPFQCAVLPLDARHKKTTMPQNYHLVLQSTTPNNHQILHLRKVASQLSGYWRNCYWTELFLNWTDPWLNYLTELLLDWTSTWTVPLLNCSFTELLLYWTTNWLNNLTELNLYWTTTYLNCYLTELLLDGTVTLLNYYWTELLLGGSVTCLNYYLTELLLIQLVLELLLYWTVTWLNSSCL